MILRFALAASACLLAGCSNASEPSVSEPARISLDDTGPRTASAISSPDTSLASWSVAEDGQAIHFGDDGEDPLLTLACDLRAEEPLFEIIRHAKALPGQSALFPFIGNGMRSRFMADAALDDGEWRWEATLAADDPQLNVFAGQRDFTATLPGHGMLEIGGSRIPGEFLEWCRSGGENTVVEAPEPEPDDQDGASDD